jgi:hypothetical protein
MMPTPFVLNDAVAIKKTIKQSSRIIQAPIVVAEPKVYTTKPIPVIAVPNMEPKIVSEPTIIHEAKSIPVAKKRIIKPKPKKRIPLELIDAPIDPTRQTK